MSENNQPTLDYNNTLFSHHMLPIIDKPTRITPHLAILIDHIILSNHWAEHLYNSHILVADISDHYPISATFGTPKPTTALHGTETTTYIDSIEMSQPAVLSTLYAV